MSDKFRYFTTPIYYATGDLHAGHLYATLLLDVMRRHYAHRGMQTLALTGMDEHGEKVAKTAREKNTTPQQLVDTLAQKWQKSFDAFDIKYDIFMRTTSEAHVETVVDFLKRCHEKGDIYFGEHEGYYCVDCENFLTSKEMDEQNNCLIHQRPTQLRKEGNYYFKTRKYIPQIIDLIKKGKICPQKRYANELIAMAEAIDADLSISRPKSRTEWGIELPFDKNHIAYVWFDALSNYVTGTGGIDKSSKSPYWSNATHIIGKDILKFHGLYWPAMLLSVGLPVPNLLVTGWLLTDGHKMSKSLGNVITPDTIMALGKDNFANTVLRITNPGEDFSVNIKTFLERFNADLANGIGNLLARTLGMIEKYNDKKLPAFNKNVLDAEAQAIVKAAQALPGKVETSFDAYATADALNEIWAVIGMADKYISDQKPWELVKDTSPKGKEHLSNVLALSIGVIRVVGFLTASVFPEKMSELLTSIGEKTDDLSNAFVRAKDFFGIQSGFGFSEIPKLYQRLDVNAELARYTTVPAKDEPKTTAKTQEAKPAGDNKTISIDEFGKVEVRVGVVVNAELVEGSDKLLKLQVSLGEFGTKQIFSGIRQWVKPEEIANRKVLIVANLAPRKMKFGMSEGMLLSADGPEGRIVPVYVADDLIEGSKLA